MRSKRLFFVPILAVLLFQTGCLTPLDVQNIAQGQVISFINALINTVTSDAIRGALGG